MAMFFTLVVLLQAVTTAQAIGKHVLFYMYTAFCFLLSSDSLIFILKETANQFSIFQI